MNPSILLIQSQNSKLSNMGTGFVVYKDDNGCFVLTCDHVLNAVKEAKIDDFEIEVIARDAVYDLALLYVGGLQEEPFILKERSKETSIDKEVFFKGYSVFDKEYTQRTQDAKILKLNSNKKNQINYDKWEIIANENHFLTSGYSGSPLILNSKVIGVISTKQTSNRGYATSIKYLANMWDEMPKKLIEYENENSPFVGLSAFSKENKHLFFGRNKEISEILEKLQDEKIIAVIGDSGSGKSSLIKAGVVPEFLEQDSKQNLYFMETRPTDKPFHEFTNSINHLSNQYYIKPSETKEKILLILEKIFNKENSTLLIYIDQFEELFTLAKEEHIQENFLEMLLYIVTYQRRLEIKIIFTMRKDYYNLLSSYNNFWNLVNAHHYTVNRIKDDALKECIYKPLETTFVSNKEANTFANFIVEKEMGSKSSELALLQMALTLTWENRGDSKSLMTAYLDAEGVNGALNKLANQTIDKLTKKFFKEKFGRGIAKNEFEEYRNSLFKSIFIRLITIDEKGNATRRLATKNEFTAKEWKVIQILATGLNKNGEIAINSDEKLGRLLKLSETVELIHEALTSQWQLYFYWIKDISKPSKILHDRLIRKVSKYNEDEKSKKYLLTGDDLSKASFLLNNEYRKFLSHEEIEYIEDSKINEERIERKDRNMLRGLKASVVVLVAFLGVSWYFWYEARESKEKIVFVLDKSVENALITAQYGNIKYARLSFRFILQNFETSSDVEIKKVVVKALYGEAFSLEKSNKYEKSLSVYSKAITYISKHNLSIDECLLKLYYRKALILDEQMKKTEKAKKIYTFITNKFNLLEDNESISQIAGAYSRLSWFKLFEKDFKGSISFARKGLKLKPNAYLIEINLAHGYLLIGGQENEAYQIYFKHREKLSILEKDFSNLKNKKISNIAFDEIIKKIKNKEL